MFKKSPSNRRCTSLSSSASCSST